MPINTSVRRKMFAGKMMLPCRIIFSAGLLLLTITQSAEGVSPRYIKLCRLLKVRLSAPTSTTSNMGLVSWLKDDIPINTSSSRRYEILNDGSLQIDHTHLHDVGTYTMKINDTIPAQFNVFIPDTRIESYVKNLSVVENDFVVLKVNTKYQGIAEWSFEHRLLSQSTDNDHFKIADKSEYGMQYGSVLEIHNIEPKHAGVYTMDQVVDGCRESAQIYVHFENNLKTSKNKKDKFKEPLPTLSRDISVCRQGKIRLAAPSSDTTNITSITWMKDNVTINTSLSRYELLDDGGLSIRHMEAQDTGIYTMKIDQTEIPLAFKVAIPDTGIVSYTKSQYAYDFVVLKVQAKNNGYCEWYFGDKRLDPYNQGDHYRQVNPHALQRECVLRIYDVRKYHSGRYELVHRIEGCKEVVHMNLYVIVDTLLNREKIQDTDIGAEPPRKILSIATFIAIGLVGGFIPVAVSLAVILCSISPALDMRQKMGRWIQEEVCVEPPKKKIRCLKRKKTYN